MKEGFWRDFVGVVVVSFIGVLIISFFVGAMYLTSQLVSAINVNNF
jgi:hypothetical protein